MNEYKFQLIFHRDKDGNSESYAYIEDLAQKSLKSKDARIKYKKISEYIKVLRTYGTEVGEPYVKHIENTDGLYELRPLRDRFFFVYEDNRQYVILNHFVKSTRKTPPKEIEKALRILKERNKANERLNV